MTEANILQAQVCDRIRRPIRGEGEHNWTTGYHTPGHDCVGPVSAVSQGIDLRGFYPLSGMWKDFGLRMRSEECP